ncbi:hypothetical protein [Parasphingopyxis sp.]|uniref:hypothetical protein n=1 Tax=Parasphingopyxis sp. TaxID=1920299 RepID=UPI00260ADE33|nr:hypothetical protein [Parasphingopyxis sp.]
MGKTLGRAIALASIIAVGGCASMQTPMTEFATDYNRVIADTRNEMILLNIVRARYREPTHYSTLSQVSGNISIRSGVSADLGGIIDDIDADAGVSLNISSSPSFQIVPLNTNQFAGGILRPIEPNVVAIFLGQGWNQHQLAALLIESVTCNGVEYANDLRNESDGTAESGLLSQSDVFGLGFQSGAAREANDAPIATFTPAQASAVNAVLENLDSNYRVTVGENSDGEAQFEIRERVPQELQVTTGANGVCGGARLSPDDYELRSVEGVIYYLGEIVRSGRGLRDDRNRLIFDVTTGSPGTHSIHVEHRGQDWYIGASPEPGGDRSIQVISLISQLIALQTSSDALERSPSTLTIN